MSGQVTIARAVAGSEIPNVPSKVIGNSMLAEDGIFCSCEGDIPTAVCGLVFNSLTSGKGVFTEIWANDFDNDFWRTTLVNARRLRASDVRRACPSAA